MSRCWMWGTTLFSARFYFCCCNREKISCLLVPMILECCMGTKGWVFQDFFFLYNILFCSENPQLIDGIIIVLLNTKINIERKTFLWLIILLHFFSILFYCFLNTCLNSFLFYECYVHFTSVIGHGHLLCFPCE